MEYADQNLPPLDEATNVGKCAAEAACVHRCLDERGVPRAGKYGQYSLWGRVCAWLDMVNKEQ